MKNQQGNVLSFRWKAQKHIEKIKHYRSQKINGKTICSLKW